MEQPFTIRRILIAVDFSEAARQAFTSGVALAAKYKAETWVLYVAEPIRSFDFAKKRYVETHETVERVEEAVRRRLDELWTASGVAPAERRSVHLVVRCGKAVPEILAAAAAKEVDLVVIGSSSDGAHGSPLGGTSEKVMRGARCSVLCVRAAQPSPPADRPT